MPKYLEKAKKNYAAAAHLVGMGETGDMYIPSAHMAYYSAFMLMKYALANFNSISYEDQEAIADGRGSHNILFSRFSELVEAKDLDVAGDLAVNYYQLLRLRNNADYIRSDRQLSFRALSNNMQKARDFYNEVAALYKFDTI